MVAEKVEVDSTRAGDTTTWHWSSTGDGTFSIEPSQEKLARGTRITLHLKEDEDRYLEKFSLQHIVKTYSDHIPIPVKFIDEEGKEEPLNSCLAIWMRSKKDITEEQYKEFYKSVSYAPDDPWMTIHNKAEGTIEYTQLAVYPVHATV